MGEDGRGDARDGGPRARGGYGVGGDCPVLDLPEFHCEHWDIWQLCERFGCERCGIEFYEGDSGTGDGGWPPDL